MGNKKNLPEKIWITQPNKVTNARYDYDEREENILTLMLSSLQNHITKEKPIETDLFRQPIIFFDFDNKNQKKDYLKSLGKMIKKPVSFEWTNKDLEKIKNQKIETTATIISAFHDYKGTLRIGVTLNTWGIPYLLYWGKGVGGTIFNKRVALTLRGKYSKRLYKLCKRWDDREGFRMDLDEFKEMLGIPSTYPTGMIKKQILDKSQTELLSCADVYFKYSLKKLNGSRAYNSISFKIFPNPKNIKANEKILTVNSLQDKGKYYTFVYNVCSIAYPPMKDSKAFDICNRLAEEPDRLKQAYERFNRLKKETEILNENMKTKIPLIKYILDNDFGFNYMKKDK